MSGVTHHNSWYLLYASMSTLDLQHMLFEISSCLTSQHELMRLPYCTCSVKFGALRQFPARSPAQRPVWCTNQRNATSRGVTRQSQNKLCLAPETLTKLTMYKVGNTYTASTEVYNWCMHAYSIESQVASCG